MSLRARHLMTTGPLSVPPDTPFLEIQHLFVAAGIGGAPVVDASGVVRGMITSADLLRVSDQACDEDVDPMESDALDKVTATQVASPEIVWVSPDASAAEVAQIMRARGVDRVLVGSDGHVAGLLSAFDLLEAVAKG